MAGLAARAEAPRVWIVAPMAGDAVIAYRRDVAHGLLVTIATSQFCMCTGQRKTRLSIMVEPPRPPIHRVVTVIALPTQTAAVWIIIGMTRQARAVCIVISRRCMTSIARNRGMRTDQRKARYVMIEKDPCGPAGRQVAGLAPIAELTGMHVVRRMAGTAVFRQRNGEALSVTSVAGKIGMAGWQFETGPLLVIEIHRIPVEYRVAAVAVLAEASLMRIVPAVAGTALAIIDIQKIVGAMTTLATQAFVSAQ